MKKSSVLSPQENLKNQKRNAWKGYDLEKLPELSVDQLKTLKKVPKALHLKLKKGVENHMGRPKKNPLEKENIVSIRFSQIFLTKLKKKASQEGYSAWQTYIKKVLSEKIESHA